MVVNLSTSRKIALVAIFAALTVVLDSIPGIPQLREGVWYSLTRLKVGLWTSELSSIPRPSANPLVRRSFPLQDRPTDTQQPEGPIPSQSFDLVRECPLRSGRYARTASQCVRQGLKRIGQVEGDITRDQRFPASLVSCKISGGTMEE